MPTKRITLLSPGSCKGFMTARVGNALPSGVMNGLYDVRLGDGSVRVRDASLLLNPATPGPYRGAFECLLGGVPTLFAAFLVAGSVQVHRSLDEGATFAEVTAPGTRLADAGPVFFAVVAQDSRDYVVFQNGVDDPRYYDGTIVRVVPTLDTAGYKIATSVDLGGGTAFAGSVPVAFDGSTEWDHATTRVQAFGATSNVLYLQCDGHVTSNTHATFGPLNDPFTISSDLTRQLAFVMDVGTPLGGVTDDTTPFPTNQRDERWRSMTIEASADGSAWTTLYEPGIAGLLTIETGTTGYLVALPVVASTAGKTVRYLRFSYAPGTGLNSDPDIITRIYTLQNAGPTTGGAAYGASFGTPGTTLAADGPGRSGGLVSGPVTPALYGGLSLPVSGYVGYVYRVTLTKPNPAVQVPTYVYREDAGSPDYFYLASFLGPGSYTDPGTGAVDYSRPLPDANALGIPRGTGMASVNGRLFVCGGNRLWYSQSERPFVFSLLVLFDDSGNPIATSAGSFSKAGETFQAVVGVGQVPTGAETLGTPQTGAVTVYAITDRTTYLLSGWDAASLNKTTPVCVGSRSPLSIARGSSGGFTMLDADRQARRVQGSSSAALSKDAVDDELATVSGDRLRWVSGAVNGDRYLLAYPLDDGQTNARILVYADSVGWESIDRPAQAPQGLLTILSAALGRRRTLRFSDAQLWEHAAPGTRLEPDGSRVVGEIVFPDVVEGFASLEAGAGFLLCEPDQGGSFALAVAPHSGDRSGTLGYPAVLLASPNPQDMRVAKRTAAGVGAKCVSFQPSLAITARGGTRIFRFDIESTVQSGDAATQ